VSGLVAGERPSGLVWLGILAAFPGIWLVSREPQTANSPASGGVLDGVLAGIGFGSFFAALGQVPDEAGLLPVALNQLVACAAIVALAAVVRAPWLPRDRHALGGALSGVLGISAAMAFLLATHHGDLSVSAVLASLYPAFTIILAATVLKEHIHRAQSVGLVLCAAAVALVAGGG
jgi:drug/metabolite transporter (DMT)-like permease